jgi:hypothetical protein
VNRLTAIGLALIAVAAGCSREGVPPEGGRGLGDDGRLSAAETDVLRSGSLRRLAVSDGRRAVEGVLAADCLAPDLAVLPPPCRELTSGRSPALLSLGRARVLLTTGAPAASVSVQFVPSDGDIDPLDAEPIVSQQRHWAVNLPPVAGATPMVVRVAPQRTDSGHAEFRILVG